jgi:hypothetical protein
MLRAAVACSVVQRIHKPNSNNVVFEYVSWAKWRIEKVRSKIHTLDRLS